MFVTILAGGKSKRFGSDKLLYPIGDKPLVDMVYERVSKLGFDVYLIVSPEKRQVFEKRGYKVIVDSHMIGPIGGILTALEYDDALIVGGDMPMLNLDLLKKIIDISKLGKYTVVPRHSGDLLEPLHAVYSKNLYVKLKEYIYNGGRGIQFFLKNHRELFIPFDVSDEGYLKSFFNVNMVGDLISVDVKDI